MKYNVGDKVKIRSDLNSDKKYRMFDNSDYNYATAPMINMSGQIVEIANVTEYGYCIKEYENLWIWTDEMFEDNYNNEFPFAIFKNKRFNDCNKCHAINKCKIFKKIYNGETPCGLLDLINKL